ncbi:hypothetical protein SPHINGO361_140055 [Sphingomonas sp. EC-HK361]|nr:hypothetical protein SPHINGO361_140055 [Sphingomonas sp. EC-HK361]
MDVRRGTCAFRSEQQDVVGMEGHVGKQRRSARRRQHDAAFGRAPEGIPIGMASHVGGVGIVHPRPRQRPRAPGEAHRLDQIDRHPHAGAETDDRADIAGDVGFVKRDPHARSLVRWRRNRKMLLAKHWGRVYQASSPIMGMVGRRVGARGKGKPDLRHAGF